MIEGSEVAIYYTEPGESPVDITSGCIWNRTSFDMQMNGQPGTFTITVKDSEQTQSFSVGSRVRLTIDGESMFGGYVTQVSKTFLVPVDDTSDILDVKTRCWILRGSDYNILFDKRVLRSNTGDYTTRLPRFRGDKKDGELIRIMCNRYLDLPNQFSLAEVDDVDCVLFQETDEIDAYGYLKSFCDASKLFPWRDQGTPFRDQIEEFASINSAIYYIDADMVLHYKAMEKMEAPWAFSDIPNDRPIVNANKWKGPTIGFRELDLVEDGSTLANDALVWGGKALTSGDVIFYREQAENSIEKYGRWQYAENRVGEDNFGTKQNIKLRAKHIVGGIPGLAEGMQRGLGRTQYNARFAWYAHEVPTYPVGHDKAGQRAHLRAGHFTNIILYTFGKTREISNKQVRTPLVLSLPVRQVSVSFVNLDPQGRGYVRFDGTFGLSMSDPWNFWRYLIDLKARRRGQDISLGQSVINDSSTSANYNDVGVFFATPKPNGSNKNFQIKFGYISGTLDVYVNGVRQTKGTHYTEASAEDGTITFTKAPAAGSSVRVECRTLEG